MRCILGLCAVVAIGSSAWVAEMGSIARGAEFQTPGATTAIPVIQPPAIPTVPAASPAAVLYQGTTAQPAATPTLPAPNMMPAGTYTAPMQPTTTLTAPGSSVTYPAYTYRAGSGGPVYQMTTPTYSNVATPVTATYGTPVQGYTTMPAQATNYAPVRRRFPFGLFQRWRQQATPTYTTMPGYTTPSVHIPSLYNSADHDAHVYNRSLHDSWRSHWQLRDGWLYDTCLLSDDLHLTGGNDAGRHGHKHSRAARYDGAVDDTGLHADLARRAQQPCQHRHACHGRSPSEYSSGGRATCSDCPNHPAGHDSGRWSS